MNPKLLALAAVLAFIVVKICRAHVTIGAAGVPLFAVPVPVLILAAEVLLIAGLAWLIIRARDGFRSHPYPRILRSAE